MHGHTRENGYTLSILSFKSFGYFLYIALSMVRDYKKRKTLNTKTCSRLSNLRIFNIVSLDHISEF